MKQIKQKMNYFAIPAIVRTVGFDNSFYKINQIVEKCCIHLDTSKSVLLTDSRLSDIVRNRQITMWIISKMTDLTLIQIGSYFKLDHATVLHSKRKIDMFIEVKDRTGILAQSILAKII